MVEVGDESDVGEHGEGVEAGTKDDEGLWVAYVHCEKQHAKGDLCPEKDEVDL